MNDPTYKYIAERISLCQWCKTETTIELLMDRIPEETEHENYICYKNFTDTLKPCGCSTPHKMTYKNIRRALK